MSGRHIDVPGIAMTVEVAKRSPMLQPLPEKYNLMPLPEYSRRCPVTPGGLGQVPGVSAAWSATLMQLETARERFRRGAPLSDIDMELINKYGAYAAGETTATTPEEGMAPAATAPAPQPKPDSGWKMAAAQAATMAALMLL